MPTLLIVIASTRPTRKGPSVARWFEEQARTHGEFDIEVADLAELNLPLFNESAHPRLKKYEHDHTKKWSEIVDRSDAVVFVTPEYNHAPPPSLINALDYLSQEWAYKPLGFVTYGGLAGGARSVQMLSTLVTMLKLVPIPEGVTLPFFEKHIDEAGDFQPPELVEQAAETMLNELVGWSNALVVLRRG